ncbi:hypothetical protein RclHR1_00900016 [Rhizophagus clarus]|uniref:Uncharacterized protein n=1 Tax=Rhizophagus clarus TaxID=94130 RepID=A0A2Z6SGK7_9GLOM|nr:hypothetical protein RclHR1_00900016 [Rhizophagus clarus]
MSLHRIIYNAKLLREIILKQLRYRHIIRRVFNAKTKCVALEQFEDGQTLIACMLEIQAKALQRSKGLTLF